MDTADPIAGTGVEDVQNVLLQDTSIVIFRVEIMGT
jgi:hypothetical protein